MTVAGPLLLFRMAIYKPFDRYSTFTLTLVLFLMVKFDSFFFPCVSNISNVSHLSESFKVSITKLPVVGLG